MIVPVGLLDFNQQRLLQTEIPFYPSWWVVFLIIWVSSLREVAFCLLKSPVFHSVDAMSKFFSPFCPLFFFQNGLFIA